MNTKRQDTASALQAAAQSLRHSLDPVQWAADTIGWHADPWQADYLRCNDPQVCLVVSRQAGKSQATAVKVSHIATFEPGALSLIVSPSQRQATETLMKVRSVLTHPGLGNKLVQDAATSLEMPNGSRVVSIPSSPDAIRGYSAPRCLVEDESAYVDDAVHLALSPMRAASPRCQYILLSTPAGMSGHFHAAAHSPNYRRFKITAHECPRISKEFLEQELRTHGDLFVAREYECCFSDSTFQFFGSDLLEAAFNCDAEPLRLNLFT